MTENINQFLIGRNMRMNLLTASISIIAVSISFSSVSSAQQADSSDSVCKIYSNYVTSQCVPKAELKKNTSREIKHSYSVINCRKQSFKMILESDVSAGEQCKIVSENDEHIDLELK